MSGADRISTSPSRRRFSTRASARSLGADLHGYNVRVPQPGHREEERAANPFFGIAPFNLTAAMTELLSLGIEIEDIVATTTANPARMLRMEDEIGTLKPGLDADVSVIEIEHGRFPLFDNSGSRSSQTG